MEYRVVQTRLNTPKDFEELLTTYGREGWEFVTIMTEWCDAYQEPLERVVVFKRDSMDFT